MITRTIDNFLDVDQRQFAMSIVENRAIPSVIDGLKPVQRKIIFIANRLWKTGSEKPMSSSTRAVMKYKLTECLECMIDERVIEAYNVSEALSINGNEQFDFIVMVKKPYELKFERIQLMCHN